MIRSRKFDSCPCIQIRRDVTLKKYLVPVLSLILVFSLSAGVVANAAFPASESLYLDTSQPVNFRTGSTTIGSSTAYDLGGSALSYGVDLGGLDRTVPGSITISFWLKGNQYFPGGHTYNLYAEGHMQASNSSVAGGGTLVDRSTPVSIVTYPDVVASNGDVIHFVSLSGNTFTYTLNGVTYTDVSGAYSSYSASQLGWYLNSNRLYVALISRPATFSSGIYSGNTPYNYGVYSSNLYYYNTLNSIEFDFSNVSGADSFTFTAPANSFSCYNGYWKMNVAITVPYGADYDSYINVRFNFSNPSSSGNISSLYFSFEDMAYTDSGTFDPNSGSLGQIQEDMQSAADSLRDIASQLQGIAQEYTLGQCLTAVNNIYQYLSGNIYPLLNSMNSSISGIYGYMTGTMQGTLTSILTQIGNVVTAVNKAGSDIVSALEAQTAALIAYFESVFSKAGEDLDQTNDDLNNSITDFNQQEDALTGDFHANWSSFDFESYEVDASLGNAFTWVSGRFMDLWNALGSDVQLLITIPCVLGLGMMVVTGSSRYFGRARVGKGDDDL